ncbi:PQQ-dependent sugar dehydrogenase [Algoriphagus sp. CAU 1675]|uniref:PQQ-dependent sugar dehydrogenase n=1 Tax=Algoriphagus sp. CAU 1675 TaxID=3032597 RepID=UPI0023DBB737|nr:PQQ-dependent sugar dehydrogenase [Algoriphagus sp. CAU 1675]MDF2159010.1 PQQ-dependent sugar dehydrogenase [Algoriphagus sp. CAU 1675]
MGKPILYITLVSIFAVLVGCKEKETVIDSLDSPYPINEDEFSTDTLTSGFAVPYGLVFLSENDFLISDRVGKLLRFRNGVLGEISGGPEVITFGDPTQPMIVHGGLMDLSLHPQFPQIPWIYVAYFAKDEHGKVARFQLVDNEIVNFEHIFQTRTPGYYGNGMRIVWQDDSHFFLNIGTSNYTTRNEPILVAQDLNEDWGKIHRLNQDGSTPEDNPILEDQTSPTSIYSYGHRDVQGLVFEPSSQTLYGIEHGPKGGDELNIIVPGKNYGWPLFTYGTHYDGQPVSLISEDSAAQISVLPQHFWTVPTSDGGRAIAPSSAILVKNSNFPEWNDHFLVSSLAFRRLLKYDPESQETYGLKIKGRIRSLFQEKDGTILLLEERNDLTRDNGMLVRVRKP